MQMLLTVAHCPTVVHMLQGNTVRVQHGTAHHLPRCYWQPPGRQGQNAPNAVETANRLLLFFVRAIIATPIK